MKRYLLSIQLIVVVFALHAQTLTVNAPSHVQNGENFRLTYTVNTQNVDNFQMGSIPEALEVITGPYTSRQSSYQMVNGHTSSSSSITYTFILCANKSGSFTITPAHVNVGGKSIASNPVKVTVTGSAPSGNQSPRMHNDEDDQPQMKAAGTPISGNDLFIRVNANKRRVHEQEPVLLTYKVYTLVDLTQLEGKMPDLTGFHTQEVPLPQQKSFHVENVNGRNYRCVTWSQYVMYPQMTGKLEIPSITFNGTIVQQNRNVDPFEAFFNGGSGYVEVKRSITAPGLTIQVDPLPERPANFSGGVGKFNISAQLNKKEIRANDPITIRVVIGGTGNLKLIKQPTVNFPKDFDKYDAKVTDKTKLTANGVEGNMIYDFLAVPRNKGQYTIPPVEFVYYDTSANAYKTIKSEAFQITVEEGDGTSGGDSNYMDEKDQDIHGLKTGAADMQDAERLFFGGTTYWVTLLCLIAAFIVLLIVFRHRAIENADIVKMRGKKANKVATKRLRKAKTLMEQKRQGEFYDEVLRALWGYAGDKMNMPVTELTHDNIAEKLSSHQIDTDTISRFIEALDECEFERYAPGDAAGNMNKTYETAMTAITTIEDVMKKNKKAGKRSSLGGVLVVVSIMLWCPCQMASAQKVTKEHADGEYAKGNYQQAIAEYEQLLKEGASPALFYNLGNAYYRTENITRAVLNYERAIKLSPTDNDIRHNLQLARSKTIDKVAPRNDMFFITWYRSLVNMMSVDGWAWLAVISISLALLLVLLYLFAENLLLRKIGFFGGLLFLVFFIMSNIFAFQQKAILQNHSGAIVVAPSASIKKTPEAGGVDQSVVHEGTRVDIVDDTMKDWKAIRLDDGREGWIQTAQIERI